MKQQFYQVDVSKYFSRGVIIDSNLFVLLIVGFYKCALITSFKRTSKYSVKDFRQLAQFINDFQKIIVTPNVLTEVSNLLNSLSDLDRIKVLETLKNFINEERVQVLEEYIPSKIISNLHTFSYLGLTDYGIQLVSQKQKYLVITDDALCHRNLLSNSIDSIYFTEQKQKSK